MECGQGVEVEGGEAGPGRGQDCRVARLGRDTRMIDREQPGAAGCHAGDPDLAPRGGRAVAQPAAIHHPALGGAVFR